METRTRTVEEIRAERDRVRELYRNSSDRLYQGRSVERSGKLLRRLDELNHELRKARGK